MYAMIMACHLPSRNTPFMLAYTPYIHGSYGYLPTNIMSWGLISWDTGDVPLEQVSFLLQVDGRSQAGNFNYQRLKVKLAVLI